MERPEQRAPRWPSLRAEWPAASCLLIFFVIAAVVTGAWRDVPVVDDWTYAWSVEQLLQHGRMAVLEWSAVYPLGPALWGTAWSYVFGFSFATLRASTLVLALMASGALYFLLRELEATPPIALLGSLSVAANPAFLLLSSSFMTDVPFVAFTLLALLCYVRAMRRGDPRLLWWGGAWACVSCMERQVGVLTLVAVLPLLIRPAGRMTRRGAALALTGTGVAMMTGTLVVTEWLHPTAEMTKLIDRLAWLLLLPFDRYVAYNLYSLSAMAFYALPALLAMAGIRHLWGARTLAASLGVVATLMIVFLGEIPLPLRPGNTWTLAEVGGSRQLIGGNLPRLHVVWLEVMLRGAGLLAMALAPLAILYPPQPHRPAAEPRTTLWRRALNAATPMLTTPRAPLVVYLAAYLVLVNVLWFYNDRYLLILLPVGVALALGHRAERPGVPRLAWALTALFGVVALAGTRDTLRFNQAVRDSWQTLVESGVRPTDIDAGYAWTGWVLYAHPENLAEGLTSDDVPWVTSKRELPYKIAKAPVAGYDVASEMAWTDGTWWPGPDRLFVLKRQGTEPAPAALPRSDR